MSDKSAIEWTDATWNPTTGCTKVSPACAHCYIERTPPFRVRGRKFVNGHIPLELHEDRLDAPLKRRKPTMYFVNSLSDLFHDDVPDAFIDRVFAVMALAEKHTFQVLTKRADRMLDYIRSRPACDPGHVAIWTEQGPVERDGVSEGMKYRVMWPLPNVWLGVSVENQRFADERIPLLLQTPAHVRFLSCEPLLGPLNLSQALPSRRHVLPMWAQDQVDWVIVGAESGPNVRPTDPAWVRSVRDQCVAASVPFFFKQWGGRTSKSGGRDLDGRTWDEMPVTHGEAQSPDVSTD